MFFLQKLLDRVKGNCISNLNINNKFYSVDSTFTLASRCFAFSTFTMFAIFADISWLMLAGFCPYFLAPNSKNINIPLMCEMCKDYIWFLIKWYGKVTVTNSKWKWSGILFLINEHNHSNNGLLVILEHYLFLPRNSWAQVHNIWWSTGNQDFNRKYHENRRTHACSHWLILHKFHVFCHNLSN